MNALKDLRINGLKDLKINGLKYLKIDELKHLIPKPRSRDDTELGDLIKSKKEVETKIRKLFKEKKELESQIEKKELESRIEKKELESRISQLHEIEDEKMEEIPEFPWREEIFPPLRRNMHREVSEHLEVETGVLQKEDSGIPERIDSQIDKKVENPDKPLELKENSEIKGGNIAEAEVKEKANSASEENDMKSNEEANLSKKDGEVAFTENTDKPETVGFVLEHNEKEEEKILENEKTESEKPAPGIFGNGLIQELLESEDLCPDEDQNFMKYIGESSALELITDLKEVKELLTDAET